MAKVVLDEDYKIVDLYEDFSNFKEMLDSIINNMSDFAFKTEKNEDYYRKDYFMKRLAMSFSTPVNSEDGYIITQYISQLSQHMKYDGIRFRSSLHEKGKNITLFKDKCRCISSCLVQIKNIAVSHDYLKFNGINNDYNKFQMWNDIIPNMKEKISNRVK